MGLANDFKGNNWIKIQYITRTAFIFLWKTWNIKRERNQRERNFPSSCSDASRKLDSRNEYALDAILTHKKPKQHFVSTQFNNIFIDFFSFVGSSVFLLFYATFRINKWKEQRLLPTDPKTRKTQSIFVEKAENRRSCMVMWQFSSVSIHDSQLFH